VRSLDVSHYDIVQLTFFVIDVLRYMAH